jgi:hypothetical protein
VFPGNSKASTAADWKQEAGGKGEEQMTVKELTEEENGAKQASRQKSS